MRKIVVKVMCFLAFCCVVGCKDKVKETPVSMTGVKEALAEVKVGSDGLTNEQRNIKQRLAIENEVGAIKHLYVFS